MQKYADLKNNLSNALEIDKNDLCPPTLADAIRGLTRFHRGTKVEPAPTTKIQTSFAATDEPRCNERTPTGTPPSIPTKHKWTMHQLRKDGTQGTSM